MSATFDESAHPRMRGGRFATKAQPESTGVSLVSIPGGRESGPVAAYDPSGLTDLDRECLDVADLLVSRRTVDGAFTEVERDEDVHDQMRALLTHIDDESLDLAMADVGRHAENVSVLERCAEDPRETDSWHSLSRDVGLDPDDFAADDREPGDDPVDYEALHAQTLAEHDLLLHTSVRSLVFSDRTWAHWRAVLADAPSATEAGS